jgi:DNA-binding NtrC family response regulator
MAQSDMTAAPPNRPKRPILVVDDEPEMLYSLKNLLRRDYDITTARSGEEGMKILEEREIHIVMTDQRMPAMTGVEMLRRMKSEHPGAMRLIFTGYADVKTVIEAINQGNVFRYITKPWDPEELLKALGEAGDRYDRIIERNLLLTDLRKYEARCVAYADGLLAGKLGTLTKEGTDVGKLLLQDGRALAGRLDRSLESTLKEPMC